MVPKNRIKFMEYTICGSSLQHNPPYHRCKPVKKLSSRHLATFTGGNGNSCQSKTTSLGAKNCQSRCGVCEGTVFSVGGRTYKILREARDKGDNPADDDMIRLQLETLLAKKARLAPENSVYARENCFLREIVECHQLTMQDVVYLDEGIEEVTEVYPIPAVSRMRSVSPPSPTSPRSPPEVPPTITPQLKEDMLPIPIQPETTTGVHQTESPLSFNSLLDVPRTEAPTSSSSPISTTQDSTKHSDASS